MPYLEPLFPYAGSKRDLIKNFSIYLERVETYVETFFGGGSVWCFMNNYSLAEKYIINDANSELIGLYQDIKSDPESVITEAAKLEEEYKKLPMCELEHYFNKQKYHYSQRQTSGRLLFLANTCFGGHWDRDVRGLFNGHSGHQISQRSPDRQIVSPGQVMLWHEALQRTEIMCGDYHNLNTPTNCIVFCDPPYRGAKNDYDRPFDDEQQVRLFRWCTHLSNDTNVCIIQTNRSDGKFFEGMFNEVNLGKIIKFMTTNTNSPSKHRSMEIVMIWNPLFNNPQKYGIHFE